MNYPSARQTQIIPIRANPSWVGMFRKIKKFSPVLFFAVGALMLLASMTNSKPHNEIVEVVDYTALHNELAAPEVSEPVVERPEAVSDLPKLSDYSKKNKAAPVNANELLRKQTIDYIERYSKIAVGEMKKFGIPASISLAQGLIESRAGTSKLAVANNNHFGMKCFSKSCRKGHCSNFTDDTHKDFFRKFPSSWESWRAHSELISSGRYAKLKRHGKDYRAWAYGLKSVGYATDRTYAEKLIGIIERYDLHQYD